ncbi:response regulator, partial [Bacteroidota bacterium]
VLNSLKLFLEDEFKYVETTTNPNTLPSLLQKGNIDVVLLDMNFSAGRNTGNEGLFWLKEILKYDATVSVVLITAYGNIELAIKAITSHNGIIKVESKLGIGTRFEVQLPLNDKSIK